MLDVTTLALFTAACAVLTATPGPDMLLIASRSMSQGRAAGFMTYAGIATGSYLQALAAAYLAYLAWKTLRSPATLFAPTADAARFPLRQIFLQGLLTNLLNPKMALFMLALLPQFLKPEAGSLLLQVVVLASILNVMGLIANGIVIVTASRLGRAIASRPHLALWPQRILGVVFGGLALRLAFASRD